MGGKAQTGLVLEVKGRTLCVLTAGGEFKQIGWEGLAPLVGEYVEVPLVTKVAPPFKKYLAYGAVAAVLLLGFFSGRDAFLPQPAAVEYVAMDINPSLELALGGGGKVVAVIPLNDDARRVLSGPSLVGNPWQEAVATVIQRARSFGFLHVGNSNLVTATAVPAAQTAPLVVAPAQVEQSLVQDMSREKVGGSVAVGSGPAKLHQEASAAGLSMNKYILYQKAVEAKVAVTTSQIRNTPINTLLQQSGLKLQMVYPRAQVQTVPSADNGPGPSQGGIIPGPLGPRGFGPRTLPTGQGAGERQGESGGVTDANPGGVKGPGAGVGPDQGERSPNSTDLKAGNDGLGLRDTPGPTGGPKPTDLGDLKGLGSGKSPESTSLGDHSGPGIRGGPGDGNRGAGGGRSDGGSGGDGGGGD